MRPDLSSGGPTVTLDLWHTLIYLPPADEEAYIHAQSDIATRILAGSPRIPNRSSSGSEDDRTAFDAVYQAAVDASMEGRTVTPGEQFRIAAGRAGREASPSDYLALLQRQVQGMAFGLADGALEFLRALRADGYRVVVISNTVGEPGAFLRPILSNLGFDPYVEAYVFSDELPWTKPSPEIFRAALGRVDGRPENSLHVGDGWSDIEGARRAKFRTAVLFTGLHEYGARYLQLFMSRGWDRPPSDHTAARLDEVARIIRRELPP